MSTATNQIITHERIEEAITYEDFRELVKELYEEGKTTSGTPQGDIPLLEFTRMNMQRMNRLDKQVELKDEVINELQSITGKWYWVTLVEGWCGDVAQNLPIIAKMADFTDNVALKLILRDQYPDIIDQYLTNGGRSIPKLICLRASDLEELGTWGPRPEPVQEMVLEVKRLKASDTPKKELVDEYHEKMHKWYAEDKGQTIQDEFAGKIKEWKQH